MKKEEKRDIEGFAAMLESAWKNTLFGQFHHHLMRLRQRFVVFGFNSASYDNVLLCPHLCIYFKNLGKRVSVTKNGNSVVSMRMDEIDFRDVRFLISPGYSLEKFRSMCGLKSRQKMMFPFELLDESQEFLKRPELPSDNAMWRSSLTGEIPDQDDVDRMRAIFAEKKVKNCGEFLKIYLKEDVLILLESLHRLRNAYYTLFSLDFIDSAAMTISSLAMKAGQLHLYRNKSIGFFTQNRRRVYAMLRRGHR